MDIRKIIEEYKIVFDSMEDETGLNEFDNKESVKENLDNTLHLGKQNIKESSSVKKLLDKYENLNIEIEIKDDETEIEIKDICPECGEKPCQCNKTEENEESKINAGELLNQYEGLLLDPDAKLAPSKLTAPVNTQRKLKGIEIDKTGDLLDDLLKKQEKDAEAREQNLKEEKINEISKEKAELANDLRQFDVVKAQLALKKAEEKAKKSNKGLKSWKKSKGIEDNKKDESLNEEVVAKFDNGKHEIVKCNKGYYNRYNIKEGKARFTTKCVESLPTALSALKKRFPKAEEVK